MRPTDTTGIRDQVLKSRARYSELQARQAEPPTASVTVNTSDMEALLAELDELRGRKTSDPEAAAVQALQALLMTDAQGNQPYALLHWKGDEGRQAARSVVRAVQDGKIPGIYMSTDPGLWGAERARLMKENLELRSQVALPEGHFPMSQARLLEFLNEAYDFLQMPQQNVVVNEQEVPQHLQCLLVNMGIRHECYERLGAERDSLEKERDSLKQENLKLRSRTVFPKAAQAAHLAKMARYYVNSSSFERRSDSAGMLFSALHAYERADYLGQAWYFGLDALYAYEKEDAEYPFVPAACDVRRIMLEPSGPGEGEEVYAENVEEVEARLLKLAEGLEESRLEVIAEKTRLEWLFTHCVAVGMGAPPAGVTEAGMTLEGRICAFTQGLIEDVGNYKLRGDILERDARRWRAFRGSARIRVLGSAGLTSDSQAAKDNPGYAHIGLEIWTIYPGDHTKENALGQEWLTKYADIAVAGGLGS